MVEVLQVQDHLNAQTPFSGTTTDDWLAHDHDVPAPVYLFAYPSHTSTDPHRSRWDIAWPVGGPTVSQMVAWRHIHLDSYENESGLETDPPRYVYGGAITKTAGPGTVLAKRFLLAVVDLPARQQIEALAAETPLERLDAADMDMHDAHAQGWIRELLDRMVQSAVISGATRDSAIEQASSGKWMFLRCAFAMRADLVHRVLAFLKPHSPLVLGLCE